MALDTTYDPAEAAKRAALIHQTRQRLLIKQRQTPGASPEVQDLWRLGEEARLNRDATAPMPQVRTPEQNYANMRASQAAMLNSVNELHGQSQPKGLPTVDYGKAYDNLSYATEPTNDAAARMTQYQQRAEVAARANRARIASVAGSEYTQPRVATEGFNQNLLDARRGTAVSNAGFGKAENEYVLAGMDLDNAGRRIANSEREQMTPAKIAAIYAQNSQINAKTAAEVGAEKRASQEFEQATPARLSTYELALRRAAKSPDVSPTDQQAMAEAKYKEAQANKTIAEMNDPMSVTNMQQMAERRSLKQNLTGFSPQTIEQANAASAELQRRYMPTPTMYSGESGKGRIGGEGLTRDASGAAPYITTLDSAVSALEQLAELDPDSARIEAMKIKEPPAEGGKYEANDYLAPWALGGRSSRSGAAERLNSIKQRLDKLRGGGRKVSPQEIANLRTRPQMATLRLE